MSRLFKTPAVPAFYRSAMSDTELMGRAAAAMVTIIHGIEERHRAAPTPCAEYDVNGLVNHLLFWGPVLEAAGRKRPVPPSAATDSDVDLTGGDWAAALEAQLDRTVEAWAAPGAWDGMAEMAGMELPAPLVGGMAVTEMVVHGWDLARATGRSIALDEDVLRYVYDEVAKSAEQGRAMGVYRPEVVVPDAAPLLDRALGLTGRDPAWTP